MKQNAFYSTSSKPTCDKPKAEGRRPESASEASSTQPEVYSSRTGHMPKAPTCIRIGVNILGIIYTPEFRGCDGKIQ